MKFNLSLGEVAALDGLVVHNRVLGMPLEQQAMIAKRGPHNQGRWQIMRINPDGTATNWQGAYPSADEALADLQKQIDDEM
jgi:hypothetical protein